MVNNGILCANGILRSTYTQHTHCIQNQRSEKKTPLEQINIFAYKSQYTHTHNGKHIRHNFGFMERTAHNLSANLYVSSQTKKEKVVHSRKLENKYETI